MRRIISLLLGIATLMSCSSCHLVYLHMFQPTYEDISRHPRMRHLIGSCLELKQDVWLYQYEDTKEYAMDVSLDSERFNYSFVKAIPKGTKLYVSKILEKKTDYESFVSVIAYLDLPLYADFPVDIYFLLKRERGAAFVHYPQEPELALMGREITPYINVDVLGYCHD